MNKTPYLVVLALVLLPSLFALSYYQSRCFPLANGTPCFNSSTGNIVLEGFKINWTDILNAQTGNDNASWNQTHADTLYAAIGGGGDNASWNETYASTLYADISVTGDNASWNETYADTLYSTGAHTTDTNDSLVVADLVLENASLWVSLNALNNFSLGQISANLGNFSANNASIWTTFNALPNITLAEVTTAIQNSTICHLDGTNCPASSGDNASWNETYADTLYLAIGATAADTVLFGGQTTFYYLNTSGGTYDNASWTQLLATTLYYPRNTNPQGFYNTSTLPAYPTGDNESWNQTHADTLYADISVTGDNASWNETYASTLYADISVIGDNTSWNQTHATTLYADISVVDTDTNRSDSDIANIIQNTTIAREGTAQCSGTDQIYNVTINASGVTILCSAQGSGGGMTSWVVSNGSATYTITDSVRINITAGKNITINQTGGNLTIDAIDTDTVLSEATVDSYADNNNYIDADTDTTDDLPQGTTNFYDNASWNETYADTLYAAIGGGGDNASWNQTGADLRYYGIDSNTHGYLNSSYNSTYAGYATAIGDLQSANSTTRAQIVSIGNWTQDRTSYYNTTQGLLDNQTFNQSLTDSLYSTGAHTTDTNCSALGSCTNVAYMNLLNTGTFNITSDLVIGDRWIASGGTKGLNLTEVTADLTLQADITGTNTFTIATTGTFLEMTANPGAGNDFLMFSIQETQGATTEINFYEGGTTHNRFWDSGSARFGGAEGSLCTLLTGMVDCDTAGTGADVIIQDDLWIGGRFIGGNGSINTTDTGGLNANGTINASAMFSGGFAVCTSDGTNCPAGDNASWNQTGADLRYYPLNTNPQGFYNVSTLPASGGDNSSWNQSLANTLYYGIDSNTHGYLNSSYNSTYATGITDLQTANQTNNASVVNLLKKDAQKNLTIGNSSSVTNLTLDSTRLRLLAGRNVSSITYTTDALGNFNVTINAIDTTGAGSPTTVLPATNISSGTFGSLVGGNDYLFPGILNVTSSVFIGGSVQANNINTTGASDFRTMVGLQAGQSSSGLHSTFLGYQAGDTTAINYLVAIGYGAGRLSLGDYNVFVGEEAGLQFSGNKSVAVGYYAGRQATGDNSTFLGYYAGQANTGDNVVGIGYGAGDGNIVDDQFILKQGSVSLLPLIQGDFSTGYVGIGTTIANQRLQVNGSANVTADIWANGFKVCTSDGTNCPASSGDNASWNQSLANTLYYGIDSNTHGYLNSSYNSTYATGITNLQTANITTNGSITSLTTKVNTLVNLTLAQVNTNMGNWSANRGVYLNTTNSLWTGNVTRINNLVTWNATLASRISANGNWSLDKPSYALNTHVANVNITALKNNTNMNISKATITNYTNYTKNGNVSYYANGCRNEANSTGWYLVC